MKGETVQPENHMLFHLLLYYLFYIAWLRHISKAIKLLVEIHNRTTGRRGHRLLHISDCE